MNKESSIKYPTSLLFVVITIALLSTMATLLGIFSSGGPGPWEHTSVHGQTVLLYGKGLYRGCQLMLLFRVLPKIGLHF
jgi:hypothetical protein